MKQTRRVFLTQLSVLAGSAATGKPLQGIAKTSNYYNLLSPDGSVTVYHTNDLNGRVQPVYQGLGGLAQFKTRLQTEKQTGLLLDAGGFLSDSRDPAPHLKLIGVMNAMGYQAVGLSSKELAAGQDNLAALAREMRFKLINCNHQFTGSLNGLVRPYTILYHNGVKIGVTAVCKKLKGIKYAGPVQSANRIAAQLKERHGCRLVICLSHLGNETNGNPNTSLALAMRSENIDLIIGSENGNAGGRMCVFKNGQGGEVMLATAGRNCITAGRVMLEFNTAGEKRFINSEQWVPGAPAGQHASVSIPYLSKIKDKLIFV